MNKRLSIGMRPGSQARLRRNLSEGVLGEYVSHGAHGDRRRIGIENISTGDVGITEKKADPAHEEG
jgi:hypothetical protein